MFVTVQSLANLIDKNIQYLYEAREVKYKFEEDDFNAYEQKMLKSLDNQIKELCRISNNKKLIEKYINKVSKVSNV